MDGSESFFLRLRLPCWLLAFMLTGYRPNTPTKNETFQRIVQIMLEEPNGIRIRPKLRSKTLVWMHTLFAFRGESVDKTSKSKPESLAWRGDKLMMDKGQQWCPGEKLRKTLYRNGAPVRSCDGLITGTHTKRRTQNSEDQPNPTQSPPKLAPVWWFAFRIYFLALIYLHANPWVLLPLDSDWLMMPRSWAPVLVPIAVPVPVATPVIPFPS